MSIKKGNITFEGNTYNLGNKDSKRRVSANAAWDTSGPLKGTELEKALAYAGNYDPDGLTTTAKDNTAAEAGYTIADNTIIGSAWDGTNDMNDIILPAATVGNYVIIRQTAEADGANKDLVIECAGTDKFAGDDVLCIGTKKTAQCDVSAASDDTLTIENGGTTNYGWGAVGDYIVFFCRTEGFWNVKIPAAVGNGDADGGTVAFS